MNQEPKRLITTLVLVGAALAAFQFAPGLFGEKPHDDHPAGSGNATAASGSAATKNKAAATKNAGSSERTGGPIRNPRAAASATIETDTFIARISALNASIMSFTLKGDRFM